jgi:hypothetical protein
MLTSGLKNLYRQSDLPAGLSQGGESVSDQPVQIEGLWEPPHRELDLNLLKQQCGQGLCRMQPVRLKM